MTGPEPQSVRFDLEELSRLKGNQVAPARRMNVALSVVFSFLLIFFVIVVIQPGNLSTPGEQLEAAVVFPVLVGIVVTVGLFARKLSAGVTSVAIEPSGIEVVWPSGHRELLRWRQLRRGFALLDYTENPLLPKLSGNLWELRLSTKPASYLTKEAFDAIIDAAALHGLTVESKSSDKSMNAWAACRVVRFSPTLPGQ
jgi:hypothetical protein